MYVFDTDTLTWFHYGHPRILERVQQVGQEEIATTVVTGIETLRGRHDALLKAANGEELLRAQQRLDSSAAMLRDFPILPVDDGAAAEFDKLLKNKKLKKIGRADLLIASIVLAHRHRLISRNLRDFQQVPGLQVENWAD